MLRALARLILRTGGWTATGGIPDAPKAIVIAAPHTSNWDGFWAMVYIVAIDIEVHFFAKQSLFWFPLGTALRALGGVELDRKRAGTAVQQAVEMFENNERYYFGLAPEGSRTLKPGWKSGFYRIAQEAGVPIYLGFLDYKNKRVGIGPRFDLSDDQDADLARLREYYDDMQGRWPEKTSPITFTQ